MHPVLYDLLPAILQAIYDTGDFASLARCALVDRSFLADAARALYAAAVFAPPPPGPDLALRRDKDEFTKSSLFNSSRLPHNAPHVRTLEISGHLATRPAPFYALKPMLDEALPHWRNLETVSLLPETWHEDLFANAVGMLAALPALRCLAVNSACTKDAACVEHLVQIRGLKVLTLVDPGRGVLQALPGWLEALSPGLEGLHLKGNCGSVTPGVLRSFLAHTRALTAFSIGLSYSLTDANVWAFLGELPGLQEAEVRYYLQLNKLSWPAPALPHLRRLTIRHSTLDCHRDCARLDSWIAHATSLCPSLESVSVTAGVDIQAYHGCVDIVRHDRIGQCAIEWGGRVKVLRLEPGTLRPASWKAVAHNCSGLEELSLGLGRKELHKFAETIRPLRRLRSVRIQVIEKDGCPVGFNARRAIQFFEKGPEGLTEIRVNERHWRGAAMQRVRVCEGAGFVTRAERVLPPPWKR